MLLGAFCVIMKPDPRIILSSRSADALLGQFTLLVNLRLLTAKDNVL